MVAPSICSQPIESCPPIDKPPGREDGRTLDLLGSRFWKSARHVKGELANARRAVTRDDVRVPPFHHALPETVPELRGIDQEPARPGFLRLPHEQAECGHESAVGHLAGGGKPPQFQNVERFVAQDRAPCILYQLFCHAANYWLRRYSKSTRHILGTEYRICPWTTRARSSAWRRSW